MTRTVLAFAAIAVVAACNMGERDGASDTATSDVALSDWEGTWSGQAMPLDRDTVLIEYEMMAPADTSAWMLHLPNRPMVMSRVEARGGDSVVVVSGPYESGIHKGVQVTTRTVWHLRDGQLVGTTEARYQRAGQPDSVVQLRQTATRVP